MFCYICQSHFSVSFVIFSAVLHISQVKVVNEVIVYFMYLVAAGISLSLCFAVRRLLLCEELEHYTCGGVLFHGIIPPPSRLLVFVGNITPAVVKF